MDWLKRVVKVEATTTVPLNIRGIFSKCGEIIDLYPCKTGARGRTHVFIKFKDEHSAKLAINSKVDIPGIGVYSLSDNPRLVDQYQAVNLPVCETDTFGFASNSWDISVLTDLPRKSASSSWKGKIGHSRRTTKLSGQSTDLLVPPVKTHSCTPALSPPAGFLKSLKSLKSVPSRFVTPITHNSNPPYEATSKQQPISDGTSKTTFLSSASVAPRASTRSGPSTCLQPPACTPGPSTLIDQYSFPDARLSLYFHGEAITYDLKALDSDTRPIIELLRITNSERGNWMIVGAFYRRSGDPRAAMAVIQTMVEAMTGHGVSEADLKPAFLFLSSCETDLARQARAAQSTIEVAEHSKNARTWLQKVYGSGASPEASQALGVVESIMSSIPCLPKATVQVMDRGADVEPSPIVARAVVQQRILEREIQSLRDRQHHQSNLLSETRVAKRKLEDDFDCERDLRYRLQRCLDDTRRELEMARKMETYALDQVKREVEARRKAEDMAQEEKSQRLKLQRFSEEETAQPLAKIVNEQPQ